jgi:DNA polymerase III subunit gamma/tau
VSYLVLARKYRPRTFDDLVGQEAVSKGLTQAITSARVGHAFLFFGSRGTGKTSTARILAKALNCAEGTTPSPCGVCESCRAIESGSDVDVLEIDAASNNGVDQVRELRERVAFRPMRGRYRITILDEVHMLSGGAFNALLKTLEEPPSHAKFVFATTAPEKVPDTIRSRCQVYEFRPIGEEAIARRLRQVCEAEATTVPETVLASIARLARGGMRDSLSLLDQLLAYAGAAPTEADLAAVTGAAGADELCALADAVIDGDRGAVLRALAARVTAGGEPLDLLVQLAEHFRGCLMASLCGAEAERILGPDSVAGGSRARILQQAERCGADRLEAIVRHLVFARERARFAGPLARASVESSLLAASRSGEVATIAAIAERLEALERRLERPAERSTSAPSSTLKPAPMTAAPALRPVPRASASSPAASLALSAAPERARSESVEAFLEVLAARNAFGRLLKTSVLSWSWEEDVGGRKMLALKLRPLDVGARAIVFDPVNRSAAEKLLSQQFTGAGLSLQEAAPGADEPSGSAVASGRGAESSGRAEPSGRAGADSISPAARRALDLTGGRVVGRTPPPSSQAHGDTP